MLLKFFGILIVILLCLFFLIIYMANPWGALDSTVHNSENAQNSTQVDTLRVLTFNMAYGFGHGSDGVGYFPKPKELILEHLNRLATLLDEQKIDIVLLQEIDFDADRSGNTDQAKYLAERSGLKNYASVVSWNAKYVPFPYLPISNHFGKVKSGGAVLSRFPIQKQEVSILPKPESNPWYYNLFYPSRYFQTVYFAINGQSIALLNTHLEAYIVENRQDQAKQIKSALAENSAIKFFGGDLNSLAPFAKKFHDFNDDYGDDYRNDKTQSILRDIPNFSEPRQAVDNPDYFTFPALKLNRQLDYLFVHDSLEVVSYKVLQTEDLSDHLPILLTLKL